MIRKSEDRLNVLHDWSSVEGCEEFGGLKPSLPVEDWGFLLTMKMRTIPSGLRLFCGLSGGPSPAVSHFVYLSGDEATS